MATTPITTVHIVHEADAENALSLKNEIVGPGTPDNTSRVGFFNRLRNFIAAIAMGVKNAKIITYIENATVGVFATATTTWTFANITADDTITIAGKVLTWKVAAGGETEITIGANLAAAIAAFAAAVNAHTVLGKYISAAVTGVGVVTLTSKLPGTIGTLFTLATSDGTMVTLLPTTALGNVTATQTQTALTLNAGVA